MTESPRPGQEGAGASSGWGVPEPVGPIEPVAPDPVGSIDPKTGIPWPDEAAALAARETVQAPTSWSVPPVAMSDTSLHATIPQPPAPPPVAPPPPLAPPPPFMAPVQAMAPPAPPVQGAPPPQQPAWTQPAPAQPAWSQPGPPQAAPPGYQQPQAAPPGYQQPQAAPPGYQPQPAYAPPPPPRPAQPAPVAPPAPQPSQTYQRQQYAQPSYQQPQGYPQQGYANPGTSQYQPPAQYQQPAPGSYQAGQYGQSPYQQPGSAYPGSQYGQYGQASYGQSGNPGTQYGSAYGSQGQAAWGQQPAAWGAAPAAGSYWAQDEPMEVVGSSGLAVIAAIALLLASLPWLFVGAIGLVISTAVDSFITSSSIEGVLAEWVRTYTLIFGVVGLVVGIFHVLSSFGIFRHKGWGRGIGLLLSLLGAVLAILGVAGSMAGTTALADGSELDASRNLGPSIGLAVFYGLIFLFLLIGGRHFRRGVRFE